jgi:hypothetical protein
MERTRKFVISLQSSPSKTKIPSSSELNHWHIRPRISHLR